VAEIAEVVTEAGDVVCERCTLAVGMRDRMRGLLGRSSLPSGEGMFLRPASSVHTAFMRFPIDVVFLDKRLVVKKIVPDVPPWRMAASLGAKSTLELPAGEVARRGLTVGTRLELRT
jgi:uncharacterized protein